MRDLTGYRHGRIAFVRRLPPRTSPSGVVVSYVLVRCDCGKEWAVTLSALHGYSTAPLSACRACAALDNGRKQSIPLISGETLVEVARRTGVSLNTVYVRWRRGWTRSRASRVSSASPGSSTVAVAIGTTILQRK